MLGGCWRALPLFALLGLPGCEQRFFKARGVVGTYGPAFGTWERTPMGCSRAPIDGLPIGQSRTVATLLWQDPADYDLSRRDHYAATAPDVPLELNLLRTAEGTDVLRLRTVHRPGWLIHPEDCTQFEVKTQEKTPELAGGRPALAGSVRLSCSVQGSHVWADVSFSHCEY